MEVVPFENPFVRRWAEDYKDEELNAHFSEFIMPLIPEFFDYPNIFLYGGSGTGKTMLFRYLSFDVQKSYFYQKLREINDLSKFLEFSSKKIKQVSGKEIKYFGIYCKLTEIPSSLFRNKCKEVEEEQALFRLYLDIEISAKFIASITGLIQNITDLKKKQEIQLKLLDCFRKYSDTSKSKKFEQIARFLFDKKKQIDLYLSSLQLNDLRKYSKKTNQIKLGGLFRLFFNLAEVLKTQIDEFKNVKIYILLDEYERMEENHKIIINSLIRERNKFIEFKISSRRYGITTLKTLNPHDFILIGRDAEIIDLEYIFRNNKAKYKRLLFDVAKKRLESKKIFKDKKLTNINKLLKSISLKTQAESLITGKKGELEHIKRFKNLLGAWNIKNPNNIISVIKCDENPLIEKLNMLLVKRRIVYEKKGYKYKKLYNNEEIAKLSKNYIKNPAKKTSYYNLYEKNKIALLFQLVNEYRKRKIYSGFSIFTALSGGFVAWFLELCYNAMEYARDKGYPQNSMQIDVDSQRRAAEKVSWDFLDKVIRNLERVGTDIYYFVINTGAFFRALHLDELLREPEPTYFNTKTVELQASSKMIIENAHYWSVLQSKKPMKPKSPGEILPDVHILHPILSPAFQISYRTRGRTRLHPNDVELLIHGSEADIKKLITKYKEKLTNKYNNKKYIQEKLFNK